MLNSDSVIPLRASSDTPPHSKAKETVSAKIAELNESRSELQTRIQSLKQDLQGWRSKLDTQVKIYRDELSELKKSLNVEVEQLRSEFQELRTTLQQQQEDVEASLRNIGLQDVSVEGNIAKAVKIEEVMNETPKLKSSHWCFATSATKKDCYLRNVHAIMLPISYFVI